MKDQTTITTGPLSAETPDIEETCFIVRYSNNEEKMELYAFESESDAKERITSELRLTEHSLKVRGMKTDFIIRENGSSNLYALGTGIYHKWCLFKSTITYPTGRRDKIRKPDTYGRMTEDCFIVSEHSYSDGTIYYAFDTLEAAKKSICHSAICTGEDLENKSYQPTVTFERNTNAKVIIDNTRIQYEWDIFKSTICIQPKKEEDPIVTEMCPACGMEVTMHWDVKTMGYSAFCPHCGTALMLCDECRHSDSPCTCDFNKEEGCCQHTESDEKVPVALGISTPLGTLIVREETFSGRGVYIDLRRHDADQDLPLVYVDYESCINGKAQIEVQVGCEGRKGGETEHIVFDEIEDYFRLDDPEYLVIITPEHAATLIADLGNGQPTRDGDRTSQYFFIAKGRNSDKDVKVCLIENKSGLKETEYYYSLHLIDDVSGKPCMWFNSDFSVDALEQQLKNILDGLRGTNYAP